MFSGQAGCQDDRNRSDRHGIALSVFSGVMLLIAFPPYGVRPLMWVGFIPMLFAQYRLMPRRWSSLAVAITDVVFLGPLLWRIFGPEAPWCLTYIAISTYDSTPGIAEQMWIHVVMWTVENRVAAVKTGHAYGSAAIDSYGRVVDSRVTIGGERLMVIDDVPLGTGRTPRPSLAQENADAAS